jgi:hypothetical protein
MAQIQFIIADEQAKSADKLEKQTTILIKFTKLLVGLTWALIFIGLVQIAMMIFKS